MGKMNLPAADFLRAGTQVTSFGTVARHTVSRYGLHTIKIEAGMTAPQAEVWCKLVPEEYAVLAIRIETQQVGSIRVFILWMYCKRKVLNGYTERESE